MKLNLKTNITKNDGTEYKELDKVVKFSTALENLLSMSSENSIKYQDWALRLYNYNEIDIDESDRIALNTFVENSKLPNFIKAPILKKLEALKEKVKK